MRRPLWPMREALEAEDVCMYVCMYVTFCRIERLLIEINESSRGWWNLWASIIQGMG